MYCKLHSKRIICVYLLSYLIIGDNCGMLADAQRTKSFLETNKGEVTGSATHDETERRVLDMFGFKQRPKPGKDFHVPLLMQHLYKSHMGDEFDGQENLLDVFEKGLDLPSDDVTNRVNTARSFHHIDEDENLSGQPDHHIRLRFNLTTLPPDEVVGASDLFLHREAVEKHVLAGKSQIHRINIYQIIKLSDPSVKDHPSGGKWRTGALSGGSSRAITRLLDTRLVDTANSTWEKFDVSLATINWAHRNQEENHGLLVEIVDAESGKPPEKDEKNHVRLRRDLHEELDDSQWKDRKPTLVVYTDDGKRANLRRRGSRSKRNSRKKESNSSRRKRKRKRRRPCARHNLYVDFGEVGWREWVVAPHGYDAYYCHGQCLFPLAEHLNATNHAIVQTLTNSVNPTVVPNPCCVPTELSSISMLYVDEHDLVVLKSYPKMAVEACGCR